MEFEMAAEFSQEFSSSVASAHAEHYIEERTLEVEIAPGTCVWIVHMKVDQGDDITGSQSACKFKDLYIRDCSACKWVEGIAQGANSEQLEDTAATETDCKTLVQDTRPMANAASWNRNTRMCTAINGAEKIVNQAGMTSCLFGFAEEDSGEDGTINGGSSRSSGGVMKLTKPLFKVGKTKVGCDGMIRDPAVCEEAAVAKGRASQGPAPTYVPPPRETSANAGIGKKKALSHEEAVGGFCACSATSDMCHFDFGGKFRCVVPSKSACSDKTEMASHPGIFESQIACNNYVDGEDQSCYYQACTQDNCVSKQQAQIIYKSGNGLCYKAKTNCAGCLYNPASHPRHLQVTSCPAKRCDLAAATLTMREAMADGSSHAPPVVTVFAAFGFVVTLYGAFKHYTKQ
jgi:hypothetical protein